MDQDDPFAFIIDLSQISPSQEELLRRSAFVGEPDDQPPPCSAVVPEASAGILMVSLPETQDSGKDATALGSGPQDQDVFHTPPEKSSSLPTSGDEPFDHCTVNRALDVDDDDTLEFVDFRGDSEATTCVDLGRDSDLGFSEVQLTQAIDEELVDGNSRGIKRDAVGDEFEGFEGELGSQDDIGDGELPMKKLKLSDPKSDFDSSRACLGIESEKVEEGNGKLGSGGESPSCNVGADEQGSGDNGISMQKNLGSNGLESGEGGKQKNKNKISVFDAEQEQGSGDNGISMQKKLGSNGLESREECKQKNKNKISVFDVLKLLSENSNSNSDDDDDDNEEEEEDGVENISLLEAFKSHGLTFPRPRWWPDNDNYRNQRIA